MDVLKEAELSEQIIDEIIENCKGKMSMIIKVLDQLQSRNTYRYLPEATLQILSKKLEMPLEDIMKTITTYSFFNTVPQGLHTITICTGISCHAMNSQSILREVGPLLAYDIPDLGREGTYTTPDLLYTIKTRDCIGDCDNSPLIMVNADYHNQMNRFKLKKVLRPIMVAGKNK
jgi:NADH:ubiquinone oxidoreductase 24 kD subunit